MQEKSLDKELVNRKTEILYEDQKKIFANYFSFCTGLTTKTRRDTLPVLNENEVASYSSEQQKQIREDFARLVEIHKHAQKTGKRLYFIQDED